jgi:hypothetical protein
MTEECSFLMKVIIDDDYDGGGGGGGGDETRDAFTMASHRKPASARTSLHNCCVGSHHKWDTY